MCGITGKWSFKTGEPVERGLLESMCAMLRHRGPDGEGIYEGGAVGMGYRWLRTVDPVGGHQPIHNEDRTCWIVLDGVICNHQLLRDELVRAGHLFYTQSDAEVVLHAYEAFGVGFPSRLFGTFAVAIWDGRKKQLVLARDRLGAKPLYYVHDGDRLLFGSEIKAILADPAVARQLDLEALDDYLAFRYVPGPSTLFEGIRKTMPAQVMAFRGDGSLTQATYWTLPDRPADLEKLDEHVYVEQLRTLLRELFASYLLSGIPLGAFLSGGIDSTTVLALMTEVLDRPVKTFSVGFDRGGQYSELAYARAASEAFGAEHHETELGLAEYRDFLPTSVWYLDEPVADPAGIPLYFVARLARVEVAVAFAGNGADENLAGYGRHVGETLVPIVSRLPGFARDALPRLVQLLPRGRRLKKAMTAMATQDPATRFCRWLSYFQLDARVQLFSADLQARLENRDRRTPILRLFGPEGPKPGLDALQCLDLLQWMPDNMMMKTDKMGSAASIETRMPFLDHRLAEFAALLPWRYRVRGLTTKYLLRRAVKGIIPDSVIHRRKQAMPVPIASWLRDGLYGYARDLLLSARAAERGLFRKEALVSVLDLHRSGRQDYAQEIFSLICLELWFQTFLDSPIGLDR